MKVYIDKITKGVVLVPSPLTLEFEVPDTFTKEVDVQKGFVQKKDSNNNLLYYKNEIGLEETTESITVIEYIEVPRVITYVDSNGVSHTETIIEKVPSKWNDNKPVMIPNITKMIVDIKTYPLYFNLDDVATYKYTEMLKNSHCSNIAVSLFVYNDIDMSYASHNANTGIGVLEIAPKGAVKLKPITLNTVSNHFNLLENIDKNIEVYINDNLMVDSIYESVTNFNSIVVTLKNKSTNYTNVNSLVLGY